MIPIGSGTEDFPHASGRPAQWAATGRSGGVSAAPFATLNLAGYVGDDPASVAENLERAATLVGAARDRWAVMDAVHGADVAVVDRPGVVPGVDVLVTQVPGLAVISLGADCVPLALVGDDGRTVAAAHCGWRGLVADAVGAAVAVLAGLGSGVQAAALGASICGACYPVPPERADEVRAACSAEVADAALVTCADGQPGIDVGRGVRARLMELGVAPATIRAVDACTAEDPNLFSYRRDGVTGRQGMVVARMGP